MGLSVKVAVLTEGVRRWRVRYDVDLGSSVRFDTGEVADGRPSWYDDRRLTLGVVDVEAAGDRWLGGV